MSNTCKNKTSKETHTDLCIRVIYHHITTYMSFDGRSFKR